MMLKLTVSQKRVISIVSIAAIICFWIIVFIFAGKPLLKFVSDPEKFRIWIDSQGIRGKIIFIGMIVLQVIVAIIPGEPFEIAAGYAFGIFEGTLLCIIGALIGSTVVFLFVRRFGVKVVEAFFSREKIDSLKFLKNSRRRDLLIFIIFLIPGTPKDLLCYFAGLTKMKLSAWILITAVARFPSIVTSAVGGNALGLQQYQFAAVVFAVTFGISALGLYIYNRITSRSKDKNDDEK